MKQVTKIPRRQMVFFGFHFCCNLLSINVSHRFLKTVEQNVKQIVVNITRNFWASPL